MKNLFVALCLLCTAFPALAQEFDIRSFSTVANDLSARKEARRTVNDEPCALVKVMTNIKGMQFESNIGIVDVQHQQDGYWLYIAPRERRIKLMASGYLSKDVAMPEPAKELTVYELVVATKGTAVAKSDLVRITFRVSVGNAYIGHGDNAPVMATGSNAVYDLPRGPQNFTFSKQGFEDKTMDIDVQEEALIEVTLQPGTPATTMELPGFIIVTSEPAGAEVFLNDQRVGQTPYQGRQLPGAYTMALRNHLYHEHQEQFTLAKGGTVSLPTVQLKPRFGFLKLSTNPTEAEVILDGKLVGKSPIDRLQVESGPHNLTVRSSLYHERQENFSIIDGENKTLNYTLKPAFGRLVISSDPPGAAVYLDERLVGSTPFRENQQPSGSYNLRIELPLHSTERSQVQVKDEENTERFFALTKNYGTLAIESEDADIYLDGKKIGTGSIDHRAAPGSYTLTAKKDRHDDDSRDVFLTIGQVETIKLAPKPRTGAISIMTTPFEASGAEIWIDGKKTEYSTPAVVQLLEGEYVLEIRKSGFFVASRKLKVDKGSKQDWEATLFASAMENDFDITSFKVKDQLRVKTQVNGFRVLEGNEAMMGTAKKFTEKHPEIIGSMTFTKASRKVENKTVENIYLSEMKPAGPSNAVRSAVLPGWGTLAVTGGEKGRGRMLLFGVTAGLAVGTRLYSNNRYDAYLNPENVENRDELYGNANLAHQISLIATTMAVSISIYDVIWVINQGSKNKRKAAELSQTLQKGWIYVE